MKSVTEHVENLRSLCERHEIGCAELARACSEPGNKAYYSKFIRGEIAQPGPTIIDKIAKGVAAIIAQRDADQKKRRRKRIAA